MEPRFAVSGLLRTFGGEALSWVKGREIAADWWQEMG